jgi:hypothetical protein
VTISGSTGVGGVVMTGLPGNPVTDENGRYFITLPFGWSGTIRPKKEGFRFDPPERRHERITHHLAGLNFSPGQMPMIARAGSREVLVVPSADVEAEKLVAITEDLQVMSHIFDEKFKRPQEVQGVFIDFGDFFGRGSRQTEAIYVQGYGVLFLMEVNLAFSPEPRVREEQAEESEDADPVWQRTREKIFSPPGFGSDPVPEKRYSADKVDQLKTELIRTLKHSANIRNIEHDEWIILTVIGKTRHSESMYEYFRSSSSRAGTSRSRRRSSSGASGGMYGGGGGFGSSGRASGSMGGGMGGFGGGMMMGAMGDMYADYDGDMKTTPATVLTIRTRKLDVDAFAKGDIDFEQFQKEVEIFTY